MTRAISKSQWEEITHWLDLNLPDKWHFSEWYDTEEYNSICIKYGMATTNYELKCKVVLKHKKDSLLFKLTWG